SQRRLARSAALAAGEHEGARALTLGCIPDHGLADELPVPVAGDDLQHRHRRQASPLLEALAVAGEQALLGHLSQQALERGAIAALDGKGTRDLALAGLGARVAHEVQDLGLRWKPRAL